MLALLLAVTVTVPLVFTVPYGACGGYAWHIEDDTGFVLDTAPFGRMKAPGERDTAYYAVPVDGRVRVYQLVAFNCDRTAWSVGNPVVMALGVAPGRLYGCYRPESGDRWCKPPGGFLGVQAVTWALPWTAVPVRARLTSIPATDCP